MIFIEYPKCSTCQKAKKWLGEHNIDYVDRHIKEENPTADELKAWVKASGIEIKKLFNTSGMLYKSLNLKEKLPTQLSPSGQEVQPLFLFVATVPCSCSVVMESNLCRQ